MKKAEVYSSSQQRSRGNHNSIVNELYLLKMILRLHKIVKYKTKEGKCHLNQPLFGVFIYRPKITIRVIILFIKTI